MWVCRCLVRWGGVHGVGGGEKGCVRSGCYPVLPPICVCCRCCVAAVWLLCGCCSGTAKGKRVQANLAAKNHAVIMPDADKESTLNQLTGRTQG